MRRWAFVAVVLSWAAWGCEGDYLSGKQCDEEGRCLPGYACVPSSNLCVPNGSPEDRFCRADRLISHDAEGREVAIDCPLGCNAEVKPNRCYLLDPSNLDPAAKALLCSGSQKLILSQDATLDTQSGAIRTSDSEILPQRFAVQPQAGGAPSLAVLAFSSVQIEAGARLRVVGPHALVLLACGEIRVDGVLDGSGTAGQMSPDGTSIPGAGGPGGGRGGWREAPDGLGPGGGRGGRDAGCDALCDSGGGGGGFGGPGGGGGDACDPAVCGEAGGAGGAVAGTKDLVPLWGGSGGGAGGDPSGGPGGGGGGALQLCSNLAIVISDTGRVMASGGGGAGGHDGQDSSAGGGGGSGGAVLLEAATVEVRGRITANGGGGGAGFGDNQGYTSRVAAGGADGSDDSARAAGGEAEGLGGAGGAGGSAGELSGGAGEINQNGGGGGGGAGRIAIRSANGRMRTGQDTLLSPSARSDRCEGGCELGRVSRR